MTEETLSEARNRMIGEMSDTGGTLCPCCSQHVKIYKRPLNGAMASMLITLSHMNNGIGWTYIEDWRKQSGIKLNGGGDYGKLAYWKLIESLPPTKNQDKKSSGNWRITPKGNDFVNKSIEVASHVYIFNNEIVGWSDKEVNITECLGKKFSYTELMSNT